MVAIDWIGKQFGDVVVTKRIPADISAGRNRAIFVCLCSCGKEFTTQGCNFRNGFPNSCGCKNRVRKHGMERTKLYAVWGSMKARCLKESHPAYEWYGARGVKLDEKWLDFSGFLADMGESYSEGLTLERIDNNGNYCKDNCKWATRKEQARNRSSCLVVDFRGERMNLSALAEKYSVPYPLLLDRYTRWGWSLEKAVTTPKREIKEDRNGSKNTL